MSEGIFGARQTAAAVCMFPPLGSSDGFQSGARSEAVGLLVLGQRKSYSRNECYVTEGRRRYCWRFETWELVEGEFVLAGRGEIKARRGRIGVSPWLSVERDRAGRCAVRTGGLKGCSPT